MGRRHGRKKSLAEYLTGEMLTSKITPLLDSRRKLLAPFPMAPVDVYAKFFSKSQLQALMELRDVEGLLNKRSSCYIQIYGVKGEALITVNLEESLPIGSGKADEISIHNFTEEEQTTLMNWAHDWSKMHRQQDAFTTKVGEVANVCTSYGQVFRLWPELQGFFSEFGKKKVGDAKARSPYPVDALTFEGSKTLKPEFRPEAFEPYSMMLAEALLLPVMEGSEVATINNHRFDEEDDSPF